MNGSQYIPPVTYLKYKAKRLRDQNALDGIQISHSKALETLAHDYGFRDWNSLQAIANKQVSLVTIGQPVTGEYLGQAFTGKIKAVKLLNNSQTTGVTIVFDKAVDVVSFDSFSNHRTQISCYLNEIAMTVEKTSDGKPHLSLHL